MAPPIPSPGPGGAGLLPSSPCWLFPLGTSRGRQGGQHSLSQSFLWEGSSCPGHPLAWSAPASQPGAKSYKVLAGGGGGSPLPINCCFFQHAFAPVLSQGRVCSGSDSSWHPSRHLSWALRLWPVQLLLQATSLAGWEGDTHSPPPQAARALALPNVLLGKGIGGGILAMACAELAGDTHTHPAQRGLQGRGVHRQQAGPWAGWATAPHHTSLAQPFPTEAAAVSQPPPQKGQLCGLQPLKGRKPQLSPGRARI